MAEDFYKTLGIQRDASQADVQKAYRDLARKYHPDLNPNDKTAKEKFQKVQAAFDVLNDQSKREMYDRYGSSFESRAGGGPRPQSGRAGGAAPGFEEIDLGDLFGSRYGGDPSSVFGDLFGGQFRRKGTAGGGKRSRRAAPEPTTHDLQQQIEIPLQTSILGGQIELSVPRSNGHIDTISVKIPPGIADGAKMRLRGQGESLGGEPPGDILLTIRVAPHPWFTRKGNNLEVKLPVTLAEAVLGAKVDVPTPRGTISLRVPPHTSSGTKLRIKGHGIKPKEGPAGDLFADVLIILPEKIDDALVEAVKNQSGEPQNPRSGLHW
ncbi:MAG TPA: J domain-containing protein [Pirellulales bacterium]|jgi:DnaJ-class molecular chaperone|nr:J domain-containing protein [Pirellulales bacterium]